MYIVACCKLLCTKKLASTYLTRSQYVVVAAVKFTKLFFGLETHHIQTYIPGYLVSNYITLLTVMSTGLLVLFIITMVPVQSRTTTPHPQSLQTNTASPNQQSINYSSFSTKENLISNQNRDKIFTECADNDWVVNPDEGNSFNTFTTTGAVQCWLYCEYTLECHALSFDIMESTCILFNDSMSFLDNHMSEKEVSVGLYKRCMEQRELL